MRRSKRYAAVMLTAVFDTVIFVRALLNPSSACGRLVFLHRQTYHLVVSPPVLLEALEVLQRPELRDRFTSMPGLDLAAVIEALRNARVVQIAQPPGISRDPTDDKFLATAAAVSADYLW